LGGLAFSSMDIKSHTFDRLRKFFSSGLDIVEYAGLL